MSNFIYYEKLQDYEEQVRKAKEYDKLQQELQRKDNNWNELKEWVEKQVLMETPLYGWTFKSMLDKIKELESK